MKPALVVRVGQQMIDVLDEDDFFEHLDVWWDEEAQRWDAGGTPMWTIAEKVATALNRMKAQPERENASASPPRYREANRE